MQNLIVNTGRLVKDFLNKCRTSLKNLGIGWVYEDSYQGTKGEIFYQMHDEKTGALLEEGHIPNVVTKDLSILVARMCKDSLEPSTGIFALAMGTGDTGWDLQSPPAAVNTQRALYSEIARKTFELTSFVDASGNPSSIPTNVVDFRTTYLGIEAVGPLVEMGLIGGDASTNVSTLNPITPANGTFDPSQDVRAKDTLCNYLTFPVINKPNGATFTITWRLTF